MPNKTVFHVELIKPSHYDDDGYVIQWYKAWIPSNSLASLFAQTTLAAADSVVVQVVNEASGEIVYTIRASDGFRPPIHEAGTYTIKVGKDRPDGKTISGVKSGPRDDTRSLEVA